MLDVEVLFEQDRCLVVNKPGGVLTQAPPGIDSMEVRVKRFLQAKSVAEKQVYLGLPHRLDRPVSGAILFGTDKKTTRKLSSQFENRRVSKKYWALVAGELTDDLAAQQGSLRDYMRKIPGQAQSEIVPQDHADAQFALLRYRVLQTMGDFHWLEIELETGRTHQIRLQFGSRGNPIIGDKTYGSRHDFGPPEPDERKRCIALHARYLQFEEPVSKQQIKIEATLPPIWQSFDPARMIG